MLTERQRLVMTKYLLNNYEKKLESIDEKYQYLSSINISSSKNPKNKKMFPFRIFSESFLERDTRLVRNFFQKESEELLKEYREMDNMIFLLKNYIARCENKNIQESFLYLAQYLELSNQEKIQAILNKMWEDYLEEQKDISLTSLELNAKCIK